VPEHVQRLRWPAERLRQERRDRLRDLLAVAKASSPWHRDRLAGVNPQRFDEADLAGVAPMTRDDLMANWDGVVTDRRLTLDLVDGHLAGLEPLALTGYPSILALLAAEAARAGSGSSPSGSPPPASPCCPRCARR
jgi:hypothetical protein